MEPTFPSFQSLPAELRVQVWQEALRPSAPGVHYLFLQRKCPRRLENRKATNIEDLACGRYVLRPPLPDAGSSTRWAHRNPSVYLSDAGLWQACVESREVIWKHFESMVPAGVYTFKQSPSVDEHGWQTGQTALKVLVLPRQDLLCVRVGESDSVDVRAVMADLGLAPRFMHRARQRENRLNIAFEYDARTWAFHHSKSCLNVMKKQTGPRAAFLLLLEAVMTGVLDAKLYLVDYRASSPGSGIDVIGGRKAFECDGLRFWEFDQRSDPLACPAPPELDTRRGPWEFIKRVIIRARWEWWQRIAYLRNRPYEPACYVGLLFCQQAGNEALSG
ncbi:hypothetical protein CPLU01_15236 [Colletotrichum plurivorum]|uniref:2EXR domain-containing protein n=1 Tax=Colletotrichum plurivorum TaxID=2175906 RepID=A0A8H6JDN1_9PEZI|nr:hypothetical protein CPLU01_15236 [Colletotrichum plurivorum]